MAKKRVYAEQDTRPSALVNFDGSRIAPSLVQYPSSSFTVAHRIQTMTIQRMHWKVLSTQSSLDSKDPRPTLTLGLKTRQKFLEKKFSEIEAEYKISLGLNTSYKRHVKKKTRKEKNNSRIIDDEIIRGIKYLNSCNRFDTLKCLSFAISSLIDFRRELVRKACSNNKDSKKSRLNDDRTVSLNSSSDLTRQSMEGVIAKRRRLEKERGQPAYFKYKISANRSIGQVEQFLEFGYPEDLHISLKVYNRSLKPLKMNAGLTTYFAFEPCSTYVQALGLGLLTFIDIGTDETSEVGSDTYDSLILSKQPHNRLYSGTSIPNDTLISCGDRSYIQLIEREGFTDIHLWHPGPVVTDIKTRKLVGFSPCAMITPLKIAVEANFIARVTFRWFPMLLSVTYAAMPYIMQRRDMISFPPSNMPPKRLDNISVKNLPLVN